MRMTSVLSTLALLAGGVLVGVPAYAGPPAPARPGPPVHGHAAPVPGCGAVLTTDARLVADLTCPEGDGLVLAAGVTLDLRGHTLRGSGGGVAVSVPQIGDVTVRNGTIAGWDTGLQTLAGDAEELTGTVTVSRVRFVDNATGIEASGLLPGYEGKPHAVSGSTFTGNRSGISAVFGEVTVTRSTFRANDTALHFITGWFTLEDSRLERNRLGVSCDESGCAVRRSQVVDNEIGIDNYTGGALVADSTLKGNGIAVLSSGFMSVTDVERNKFRDNGTAVSLRMSNATLTENEFRGNDRAFTAEGDGAPDDMEVEAVLVANRFVRNGDAVVSAMPGTSLQDNVANHNRGWGIHAPGAIDLGGNQARGNGNEPQCVGVVCGSGPRS